MQSKKNNPKSPCYSQESDFVMQTMQANPEGLSSNEAHKRLRKYGPNRLPCMKSRTWLARLWEHINNALIWIMIVAAIITLIIGNHVDSAVIFLVILVNTVIGFLQEGKAERALEAIQSLVTPHSSIYRNGNRITIPAEQIVPGDIVILQSGDRVPADLRLIYTKSLRIEEAALTGESTPVDKFCEPVVENTPLAEQSCMAFSGTFVVAGQGKGVVIKTGSNTELGRISTMLENIEKLRTPLVRQIDKLAKWLTLIILIVAGILFAVAYGFRGYDLSYSFMIIVGFAVAVVPEGLPAVMTIALAMGVHRMAKRNAIIRRLPAVETLGAVSVICSDKTGTLTCNEMTVKKIVTTNACLKVSGSGYALGQNAFFIRENQGIQIENDRILQDICLASLLCNDASLNRTESGWTIEGDPMEAALIVLAEKCDYDQTLLRKQFPRKDEIPFDAEHRFMVTLHHDHVKGSKIMFIKGSPEQIIAMADKERHLDSDAPINSRWWLKKVDELAAEGQRVLAIATKTFRSDKENLLFSDVKDDLILLGLVGIIDPPRPEAMEAIKHCQAAGIRIVMITGDHAITAKAITKQLGINDKPKTLLGSSLDSMNPIGLKKASNEMDVFARANPEHKLKLVQALQTEGRVIAMTGDGVNDAPALKQADIGVAMGKKGTDVARESAEIVLADDNFASIVAAVSEGRTVYDNLQKVIAWTIPTNVGEVLAIIVAVMFALPLPITPVQTLWINMVTSIALGLVLAFEPTEPGTMQRPPRNPKSPIISGLILWRICFVAFLFLTGTFSIFYYASSKSMPIEVAHTLVVNVIVVFEIFYLFSVRYVHGTSITFRGIIGTPPVLIGVISITFAQFAVTYIPFFNQIFGTRPVALIDGILVVVSGVLFLVIVEVEKLIVRKFYNLKVQSFH